MAPIVSLRLSVAVPQRSSRASLALGGRAPVKLARPLHPRLACRWSVPQRRVAVAAKGRRGGTFDDDDDDDGEGEAMDDLEDAESWEVTAGAEEVVYDDEMLKELEMEEEVYQQELLQDAEDEEELEFASEAERALAEEEREKLRQGRSPRGDDVRVFDYDRDPRMRIMTEDGSRWDKNGIDRLKFAWEKINYEVPEVHETEEMKRLKAQAEQDKEHANGRSLREMSPEMKEWWKDVVEGGRLGDVYGDTAQAWAALDKFYNGLQKSRLLRIEEHIFRLQDMGILLTLEQKRNMTKEQLEQHEKDVVAIEEANAEEIAAISDEIEELIDEIEDPFDDYETELRNPEDPTSGYKLTLPDTLERWNALEPYVNQAFPNDPDYSWNIIYDTYHSAAERLRVVDDPVAETIPEQEEVKLNTWEMRVRYEHLKAKKQRREAYWKDFEERVGKQMRLEYDCTELNDVRLRPKDREPKVWTHEEIMAVITENGANADPEEVMKDSLTVIDPLEPIDHVFDLGVRYVPTMEESIQELGLMEPPWASERIDFGMSDPMSEWEADDDALQDDNVEEELEIELDLYDQFDKLEDTEGPTGGTKGTTKTGRKRR